MDENSIEWVRPTHFKYKDDTGKVRRYTPDFYLPSFDLYLDTKNDYLISLQQAKLQAVRNQIGIKLLVCDKNHLTWDSVKLLLDI